MKKEIEGDVVSRKVFVRFTDFQINEINAAHMEATNQLADARVEYISVETEMIVDFREMTPDDRQLHLLAGMEPRTY